MTAAAVESNTAPRSCDRAEGVGSHHRAPDDAAGGG